MNDYISRDAALAAVCNVCNTVCGDEPCEPSECDVRETLKALPSADVCPVVRGRWKQMHYEGGLLDGVNVDKCSACGWEMVVEQTGCGFRFCPTCGADMREEANQ